MSLRTWPKTAVASSAMALLFVVVLIHGRALAADLWVDKREIEQRIDKTLATSTLGASTRVIRIFESHDSQTSSLVVSFLAQDRFSDSRTVESIWDDSLIVLLAMMFNSNYPNLIAVAMFPVKDKYGNMELTPVGYIEVKDSELLKINRNHFRGRDLARIAETAIVNLRGVL